MGVDTTIPFPTTAEPAEDVAVTGRKRVDALFAAHRARLFGLALRMTAHRADSLDLLQETFVRALRHVHSLPDTSDGAEAWLVRVLVNLVRDRGRRRSVRGVPAQLPPTLSSDRSSPERVSVSRIQVRRALDVLDPRRRAILIMSDVEGLTSVEIGRQLDLAPGTVRWHLFRARNTVRDRLSTGRSSGPLRSSSDDASAGESP